MLLLEVVEVAGLVRTLLLGEEAWIVVRRALLIRAEEQECLARAVRSGDDHFWRDWFLHGSMAPRQ